MKFGLILDHSKERAIALSSEVEEYLISKGVEVEREKDNFRGVDLVIVLGGDGTLLHSACENVELGVPFVGINLGRLGFLTSAEAIDFQAALDKLIRGKYFVSERITLEAAIKPETGIEKPETKFRALNEIVVKSSFRICDIDIVLEGNKLLSIVGDGVIVATQTGSTAYSLSAGGPIVHPGVDCILVTPINAHSLPIPSVILPADEVMEITIKKGEDISFILDGHQHKEISIGDVISVRQGFYKVKFAYFDEKQFLKNLNAKFGLASRIVG